MPSVITEESAPYCFLDFDLDRHRHKFATAAAFVDATDSRYGFSSKDIRALGGSELSRIPELMVTDHEWSSKASSSSSGVTIRPPTYGSRVVVKLFWDVAPLACENFATLCYHGSNLPTAASAASTSEKQKFKPPPLGESGKPLTYRETMVHRVVPGFILQGGDIIFGNGTGGESIYNGKKFKDERAGLNLKHDRRGILSMGNSGKNSNSSQWFITLAATPQCDGKHVIFGQVVSGWEVLEAIEKVGSSSGEPTVSITITDCGVWAPFLVPGAGYWFDKPDADAYTGVSPMFITRPRVAVVGPNESIISRFAKSLDTHCSLVKVHLEQCENDTTKLVAQLSELLATFTVDVILFAPACKLTPSLLPLPASWISNNILWEDVAIESKPVDALSAVHTKSWLAKHKAAWHLDGMVQ